MLQAEQELLVLAAQDGDVAAFERLFRHHDPALRRFARSLADRAELADDAVQDAWLMIARSLRRLDDVRAFRSWLFRAVRWKVLERLRQPQRGELALDAIDPEAWPVAAASEHSDGDDLRIAMQQLPAIDRQALHLFYLQELSLAEIAHALDVPIGTVKSRLSRARRLLKTILEQQGDPA